MDEFSTPSDDAFVTVTWRPVGLSPRPGQLDTNTWFNSLSSSGAVLSIDNQTQYVANQPALVATLKNGIKRK